MGKEIAVLQKLSGVIVGVQMAAYFFYSFEVNNKGHECL